MEQLRHPAPGAGHAKAVSFGVCNSRCRSEIDIWQGAIRRIPSKGQLTRNLIRNFQNATSSRSWQSLKPTSKTCFHLRNTDERREGCEKAFALLARERSLADVLVPCQGVFVPREPSEYQLVYTRPDQARVERLWQPQGVPKQSLILLSYMQPTFETHIIQRPQVKDCL